MRAFERELNRERNKLFTICLLLKIYEHAIKDRNRHITQLLNRYSRQRRKLLPTDKDVIFTIKFHPDVKTFPHSHRTEEVIPVEWHHRIHEPSLKTSLRPPFRSRTLSLIPKTTKQTNGHVGLLSLVRQLEASEHLRPGSHSIYCCVIQF
ncbi:hypothetical protein MT325_m336R [Paramecium bursaria chlorella virus MT325]|uniref:Uncharacterized protein m336R n=1 Tax=Paramecium bursaria Chlorella virus MT325 TaxID=346932 RepID=A7IU66_PBCVM|nr:hypothetical protein MT325_m336R [Paramecium bursaria chlorella virus MT325]